MTFLADEGVDSTLVQLLRAAEHDVLYVAETERGTEDAVLLEAEFIDLNQDILLDHFIVIQPGTARIRKMQL